MANDVRKIANEIHFTLPESLWEAKKDFFMSFGFREARKSKLLYRSFEDELICSAPFSDVWNASIRKLPKLKNKYSIAGYSLENDILMSFHPEFAKKILNGEKRVEIRRKFIKKCNDYKISIYITKPEQTIAGEATIEYVEEDIAEKIWFKYKNEIGCTEREFYDYVCKNASEYVIVFPHCRDLLILMLDNPL